MTRPRGEEVRVKSGGTWHDKIDTKKEKKKKNSKQ